MTLQQCKYVLKIAECGSLNEAAKQLYVAQSSLSVSIKTLEQELGIKIFERAGSGVYLTEAGAEFVQYARPIAEQSDLILDRFTENRHLNHLNISTQHYDFVADVFGRLLNETCESHYRFSLREMKTYDVIRETELAFCDIGILAIKDKDRSIMERFIAGKGLTFTPVLKALPHVFLRKGHPAAKRDAVTLESLKDYPYVSYEQGEHASPFFTEEIAGVCSDKQVEISDRASLMNVLLASDAYTLGTGIMPSLLNQDRILSIPLKSDDFYIIGYIMRGDRKISPLARKFVEMLTEGAKDYNCKS